MWGILTFFVPSQFSSYLKFFKFVGTSHGLVVDSIGSLHLGGGQMISKKNLNPKILKNSQGYEECEESSHCSYPPKSPLIWSF